MAENATEKDSRIWEIFAKTARKYAGVFCIESVFSLCHCEGLLMGPIRFREIKLVYFAPRQNFEGCM